jgi:ABC-type multidrug transport system ATPase subunit
MTPIRVSDLFKSYTSGKAKVEALRGVSFDVNTGELFGIIGPDGAGKTSLFRILTTLILADKGDAQVQGYDVVKDYKAIRRQVGYMPGRFSLYPDLTVEENLKFFATLFNTSIDENYDLVKTIYSHIEKFKTRKAGQLSGGMKQKLALSCALIHRPSVLFLDEPTTGVDAVSRREFWELLRALQEKNITILVSTPYMDEAGLCDRVALIQQGRILQIDTPAGITSHFRKPLWAFRSAAMFRLMNDLRAMPDVESCHPFGQVHHVVLKPGARHSDELLRDLSARGHAGLLAHRIDASIEDCFMELMHG